MEAETQRVVGMAASLIVLWNAYDMQTNWRDFTDLGWHLPPAALGGMAAHRRSANQR